MENKDNSSKQNATFLGKIRPSIVEINGEITFFKGTETGIEDIDCPPDEGELPDTDWLEQPTPYDN
jgi:hypothetical protein